MTHREQHIVVSLFSALLLYTIYSVKMFDLYQAGRFEQADAAAFVGKSIFVLVFASIFVTIIAWIVLSIVMAIITRDPNPSFVVDERDNMIELKGMRITFAAFSTGFVASMVALAFGWAPYQVFLLIISSMFVGSVAGDIAKIYHYRRGI